MNNSTFKSLMFLGLIATAFIGCKKDEETSIPDITLNGPNPLFYNIGDPQNDPGGTSSSGDAVIVDYSSVYLNKRGVYTAYFSSAASSNDAGYTTREIIVLNNPVDPILMNNGGGGLPDTSDWYVVVTDNNNNNAIVYAYTDRISADNYINGQFYFNNFAQESIVPTPNQLIGKISAVSNGGYVISIPTSPIPAQTTNWSSSDSFPVFNGPANFSMSLSSGNKSYTFKYRRIESPYPTSNIRAIHTFEPAPKADLYFDGARLLDDVPYEAATDFYPVYAGGHRFVLTGPNSTSGIANINYDFITGKKYSVFVGAKVDSSLNPPAQTPSFVVVDDEIVNPISNPNDDGQIRFINTSANDILQDAISWTDTIVGTTLLNTPVQTGGTFDKDVKAGTYKFSITPGDSIDVTVEAGKLIYLCIYGNNGSKLKKY